MSYHRLWMGGAILLVAAAACGSRIEVRTMAAPTASFASLHDFRILPGPARRDGRQAAGLDDPMISNSIANRVIRDAIAAAFRKRGYAIDEVRPDFAVAFYASAREKLDVSTWDYGYPPWPEWRYGRRQVITEYTEGSVVVDVIDPRTLELLWRGEGRASLSDDLNEQVKELAKAAEAIVAKFPRATAAPAIAAAGGQ